MILAQRVDVVAHKAMKQLLTFIIGVMKETLVYVFVETVICISTTISGQENKLKNYQLKKIGK